MATCRKNKFDTPFTFNWAWACAVHKMSVEFISCLFSVVFVWHSLFYFRVQSTNMYICTAVRRFVFLAFCIPVGFDTMRNVASATVECSYSAVPTEVLNPNKQYGCRIFLQQCTSNTINTVLTFGLLESLAGRRYKALYGICFSCTRRD